jgi:hypothetical protein
VSIYIKKMAKHHVIPLNPLIHRHFRARWRLTSAGRLEHDERRIWTSDGAGDERAGRRIWASDGAAAEELGPERRRRNLDWSGDGGTRAWRLERSGDVGALTLDRGAERHMSLAPRSSAANRGSGATESGAAASHRSGSAAGEHGGRSGAALAGRHPPVAVAARRLAGRVGVEGRCEGLGDLDRSARIERRRGSVFSQKRRGSVGGCIEPREREREGERMSGMRDPYKFPYKSG